METHFKILFSLLGCLGCCTPVALRLFRHAESPGEEEVHDRQVSRPRRSSSRMCAAGTMQCKYRIQQVHVTFVLRTCVNSCFRICCAATGHHESTCPGTAYSSSTIVVRTPAPVLSSAFRVQNAWPFALHAQFSYIWDLYSCLVV